MVKVGVALIFRTLHTHFNLISWILPSGSSRSATVVVLATFFFVSDENEGWTLIEPTGMKTVTHLVSQNMGTFIK